MRRRLNLIYYLFPTLFSTKASKRSHSFIISFKSWFLEYGILPAWQLAGEDVTQETMKNTYSTQVLETSRDREEQNWLEKILPGIKIIETPIEDRDRAKPPVIFVIDLYHPDSHNLNFDKLKFSSAQITHNSREQV